MKDNRRNFLKNITIAGAAGLTLSEVLSADAVTTSKDYDASPIKTILFQGDSITDGGRSYNADWNHVYGQDYAYLITSRLNYEYPSRNYNFFNRGVSGNTIKDLAARWQKDTIDIKPDLLSILIGINDVFALVVKDEKVTADDFQKSYDDLLAQTVQALPGIKLAICEPFILPVGMVKKDPQLWTTEVQERQTIVRQLAVKYRAVYLPLQDAFDKALEKAPAEHWIWDGIHPMPAGHELIAREWLKAVSLAYKLF